MTEREKVINKVTAIVADMQEEVDEWKDYSDSELRGGLTCDCDWWYKTLQTLKDALALLKAQEPRGTCSVCKYGRCLSGEWFCFMIGTSRYGKHVTDGDWYCKDAIGR